MCECGGGGGDTRRWESLVVNRLGMWRQHTGADRCVGGRSRFLIILSLCVLWGWGQHGGWDWMGVGGG